MGVSQNTPCAAEWTFGTNFAVYLTHQRLSFNVSGKLKSMNEIVPKDDGLRTERSYVRSALVVKASGYIDLSTVDVLDGALTEALAEAPETLVVDLTAIDFLGSAGLSLLARTHSHLVAPTRMAIAVNEIAARPLQITGLDKVLTIVDTVGSVVEA